MTLIEMEGFLRGKCIPRDMLVNESNAQYLLRKLTELQKDNETLRAMMREVEIQRDRFDAMLTEAVQSLRETEKQRDGLAAENELMFRSCSDWPAEYHPENGAKTEVERSVLFPATDKRVREIMAIAIEELAIYLNFEYQALVSQGRIAKDGNDNYSHYLANRCEMYANKLRGGGV